MMDPVKMLIIKDPECAGIVDTVTITYIDELKTFFGTGSFAGDIGARYSVITVVIFDCRIITSSAFVLFQFFIGRVPLL